MSINKLELKGVKKRLIAIMLGATITASVLAGCYDSKTLMKFKTKIKLENFLNLMPTQIFQKTMLKDLDLLENLMLRKMDIM